MGVLFKALIVTGGGVPCALRHKMTQCRHGIVEGAGFRKGPASAPHHFALRRARDDGCGITPQPALHARSAT
jgi:hypothetical protein